MQVIRWCNISLKYKIWLVNLKTSEKVSDVAVMAKILTSLPSKYNSLITARDSVDAENQMLHNLQL